MTEQQIQSTALIDQLYAQTFGKPVKEWASNKLMRQALTEARRFVLDDSMARFLGDIVTASYVRRTRRFNLKAEHHARAASGLPHHVTWVEYDLLKCCARQTETSFEPGPQQQQVQEGWLLNNFYESDQEFRLQLFHRTTGPTGEVEFKTLPLAVTWRTDSNNPHGISRIAALESPDKKDDFLFDVILGFSHGAAAFPQVNFCQSELLPKIDGQHFTAKTFGPATGVMLRLWAFLSTVNDIPVLMHTAQRAKGFTAKAQHRCFLEHKTITLNVPQQTDHRKLARSVVAAANRRAHQVRGHWRKDWRHPLHLLCDHDYETLGGTLRCRHCLGQRLFIHEHLRGDASIGFVTHDYEVVH